MGQQGLRCPSLILPSDRVLRNRGGIKPAAAVLSRMALPPALPRLGSPLSHTLTQDCLCGSLCHERQIAVRVGTELCHLVNETWWFWQIASHVKEMNKRSVFSVQCSFNNVYTISLFRILWTGVSFGTARKSTKYEIWTRLICHSNRSCFCGSSFDAVMSCLNLTHRLMSSTAQVQWPWGGVTSAFELSASQHAEITDISGWISLRN